MSGSPTQISTVANQIEYSQKDPWISNTAVQLEYDIYAISSVGLQVEYNEELPILTNISTMYEYQFPATGLTNISVMYEYREGIELSANILTTSEISLNPSKSVAWEIEKMTEAVFTDYLEEQFLKHVLKNTPYTPPNGVWISLYKTNPGEENTGTEISGDSYVPVQVPQGEWDTADNAGSQNLNAINFPTASSDWGTINYIGIQETQFSGSLLAYCNVKNPKRIDEDDSYSIKVGGLDLIMHDNVSHYLGTKFLDHLLNGVEFSTPGSSLYIALYNIAPDAGETVGQEVSSVNYERLNYTNWSNPLEGVCWNLSDIIIQDNGQRTDTGAIPSWGTIRGIGIKDSKTGGNLLFHGSFTTPKEYGPEDVFKIRTGKLNISIS